MHGITFNCINILQHDKSYNATSNPTIYNLLCHMTHPALTYVRSCNILDMKTNYDYPYENDNIATSYLTIPIFLFIGEISPRSEIKN